MTPDLKKKTAWLFLNLVLSLCESYLCYVLMFKSGKGFDLVHLFQYANYANFCLFVSSWILVIGYIAELTGAGERTYYGFRLFRYTAVTASTMVFVVAVFISLPLYGFDFRAYLEPVNLLECVICPSLAYFSFTRFGDYSDFSRRETLFATLAGFLYNALIVILNKVGILEGPYSFQMVQSRSTGMTVFWSLLIVAGTFIVATAILIVAQAHGPAVKKKKKFSSKRKALFNLEKTVDDEAEVRERT